MGSAAASTSDRRGKHAWQARFFARMRARQGKVLRCDKHVADREMGYFALHAAVSARGYHLLECGGQYVIICDHDRMLVHR